MTFLRKTPDYLPARLALIARGKQIEKRRDAALFTAAFLVSAGTFWLVFAGV